MYIYIYINMKEFSCGYNLLKLNDSDMRGFSVHRPEPSVLLLLLFLFFCFVFSFSVHADAADVRRVERREEKYCLGCETAERIPTI